MKGLLLFTFLVCIFVPITSHADYSLYSDAVCTDLLNKKTKERDVLKAELAKVNSEITRCNKTKK